MANKQLLPMGTAISNDKWRRHTHNIHLTFPSATLLTLFHRYIIHFLSTCEPYARITWVHSSSSSCSSSSRRRRRRRRRRRGRSGDSRSSTSCISFVDRLGLHTTSITTEYLQATYFVKTTMYRLEYDWQGKSVSLYYILSWTWSLLRSKDITKNCTPITVRCTLWVHAR